VAAASRIAGAAPIVVLGTMRPGTVRMQRLLACDPGFDHSRPREAMHPASPRAPAGRWRIRAALMAMKRLNPALAAIHPTGADEPDGELGLLAPSFLSGQFQAQWHVPAYAWRCEVIDARGAYAELGRLLQTIAWRRGRRVARPWVLKAPDHMGTIGPPCSPPFPMRGLSASTAIPPSRRGWPPGSTAPPATPRLATIRRCSARRPIRFAPRSIP
jgi:hypothetical protein